MLEDKDEPKKDSTPWHSPIKGSETVESLDDNDEFEPKLQPSWATIENHQLRKLAQKYARR